MCVYDSVTDYMTDCLERTEEVHLSHMRTDKGEYHMTAPCCCEDSAQIVNPLTADMQIKGRAHCAELLVFFSFFHLKGVSILL